MARFRAALIALLMVAVLCLPAGANAYPNGQLPDRALAQAAQGGCVKLERNAARAWNAMQVHAGRVLSLAGCNSGYRRCGHRGDGARGIYGTQWYFWEVLPRGQAAPPCTSNHGEGRAGDRVPAIIALVNRIGPKFGWCKFARWVRKVWCSSDAPREDWHVRYTPGICRCVWPNMPLLIEGSRDRAVRFLRARLRAHATTRKCRLPKIGWYGPRVRLCVIRFQRHHRLGADGNTGPATWKYLITKPR